MLAQLTGAKICLKLDANLGFWQIPLAPESAKLTTFITPFGRYQFHRLPFEIDNICSRIFSMTRGGNFELYERYSEHDGRCSNIRNRPGGE